MGWILLMISMSNTGLPDLMNASSGERGYSWCNCHSGSDFRLTSYQSWLRSPASQAQNTPLNWLVPVWEPTHSLWKKLPEPLAVDKQITRPPTSAIGSIDAHASSGLLRNAISSTTTKYTDSPRAGSLELGSDSMADSLSNTIFNW